MNQMIRDLRDLGLREGGTLLVHSSYKSLGPLADGIEAVLDALQAAVGDAGTLLMPALSYDHATPEHPFFDLSHTPSNVGILPEAFRKRPGVLRSLHPTHSVCAAGKDAQRITAAHHLDGTPVGPHSPFRLNAAQGGQILMLGCSTDRNTTMHGAEEAAGMAYVLREDPRLYTLTDGGGHVTEKSYRFHATFPQHYHRIIDVMPPGAFAQGMVLSAHCTLFDARALFKSAVQTLQRDPRFFIREPLSTVGKEESEC